MLARTFNAVRRGELAELPFSPEPGQAGTLLKGWGRRQLGNVEGKETPCRAAKAAQAAQAAQAPRSGPCR